MDDNIQHMVTLFMLLYNVVCHVNRIKPPFTDG